MKYKLLLILLLVAAGSLAAAPLPDSARITRTTEYQDQYSRRLSSPEGAKYRVETTLIDSTRGVERLYLLPSGKLYSYQAFLKQDSRVWHGAHLEFYENGKPRLQEAFVLGELRGIRQTYYDTGVLRRREQLTPGQPTTGECFGPDGQPIAYFPFSEMPVYPGGQEALLRAIGRNTIYPPDALRAGVQGVVIVNFTIGADGKLEDVRAHELPAGASAGLRRTYSSLQGAAVRAVRQLKPFTPGQREGEPVAVRFSVPATFKIQ
ncbi:energy transducer TonB [Hymenobacter lapidiphilus]|uniref:TonB family protein n=1 Tax=Hymenobacter lapidiphilus TaxID=2608003 RepID=A0A7Y7U6H6_9BACT|nr:energy transducer TonB [Hymenobacter lapidiphilus]NVO32533.1 TonB family protein [Hymenobacter lapidiphilus]